MVRRAADAQRQLAAVEPTGLDDALHGRHQLAVDHIQRDVLLLRPAAHLRHEDNPAKDSTFEPSSGAADLTSCYQSEEAFQMALYHFMYTSPFTAVGLSAREAIVHEKSEWAKAVTKVVASSMSYSKGQEGSSAKRYDDLVERVDAISFMNSTLKQVSGFDTLDALEPLVVVETLTNIFMGPSPSSAR